MKKTYLGEFEEVILLTVALLNDQAYGVAITEALEEQTARAASTTVFLMGLSGENAEAKAPANNPCAKIDGIMSQVLYGTHPTRQNEK
jgi:hypothetical protein